MIVDAELLRCVLVTDRRRTAAPFAATVARMAAESGATLILVREKDLPEAELVRVVRAVRDAAAVPVAVAHRPEAVGPGGACGVHLGAASPTIAAARALIPAGAWISASVHAVEEGVRRAADGAAWLLLGPIRDTPKGPRPVTPIGFAALGELARRVPVPVVGIGGLGPGDLPAARAAGAAGIAGIRFGLPEVGR